MSFLINPYAFLAAGGDFESIATVTVGSGGAASMEFDNIPSTYQHLHLRVTARSNRTGIATDNYVLRYNSDTSTANYVLYHLLAGNGSNVVADAVASGVRAANMLPNLPTSTVTANIFGVTVADILDYANTSKYKTVRSFGGHDRNGAGQSEIQSGLWMSTSAITKIEILPGAGPSFAQHSTAALYGVKAP